MTARRVDERDIQDFVPRQQILRMICDEVRAELERHDVPGMKASIATLDTKVTALGCDVSDLGRNVEGFRDEQREGTSLLRRLYSGGNGPEGYFESCRREDKEKWGDVTQTLQNLGAIVKTSSEQKIADAAVLADRASMLAERARRKEKIANWVRGLAIPAFGIVFASLYQRVPHWIALYVSLTHHH